MILIPLKWVEWGAYRGLWNRPEILVHEVSESPEDKDLQPGVLFHEIRDGHPKWVHLKCPTCGDHIQLGIAGGHPSWKISVDWCGRPTLHPSIWEKATCGAHFFVRRGHVVWAE